MDDSADKGSTGKGLGEGENAENKAVRSEAAEGATPEHKLPVVWSPKLDAADDIDLDIVDVSFGAGAAAPRRNSSKRGCSGQRGNGIWSFIVSLVTFRAACRQRFHRRGDRVLRRDAGRVRNRAHQYSFGCFGIGARAGHRYRRRQFRRQGIESAARQAQRDEIVARQRDALCERAVQFDFGSARSRAFADRPGAACAYRRQRRSSRAAERLGAGNHRLDHTAGSKRTRCSPCSRGTEDHRPHPGRLGAGRRAWRSRFGRQSLRRRISGDARQRAPGRRSC